MKDKFASFEFKSNDFAHKHFRYFVVSHGKVPIRFQHTIRAIKFPVIPAYELESIKPALLNFLEGWIAGFRP